MSWWKPRVISPHCSSVAGGGGRKRSLEVVGATEGKGPEAVVAIGAVFSTYSCNSHHWSSKNVIDFLPLL